ncbi:MAG: hypothetical protein QXF15_03835 [Candidatus Aenigmatarchaeota archaeon]
MERSAVSRKDIEEIEALFYKNGCSGEIKEYCGLREILEDFYPELKALTIMQELTDMFGVSSPYPCDPIFEIMRVGGKEKIYAFGDPKKKIIAKAVRKKDRNILEIKNIVLRAFPKRVVIIEKHDPNEPPKYITKQKITQEKSGKKHLKVTREFLFETEYKIELETTDGKDVIIGPVTLPELIDEFSKNALVVYSNLFFIIDLPVLLHIKYGLLKSGRCEVLYKFIKN